MKGYTKDFDAIIREAVLKYMPEGWDWMRNKAQMIQESLLNPNAVSPAGAEGISQFMPGTFAEAKAKMPLPVHATAFMPEFAIPANAWYDRHIWDQWTNPKRTTEDRWHLTLASYNAGLGNILHAQELAHGAVDYASIIDKLYLVTGVANAAQTRGYITHIEHYYDELLSGA